MEEFLKGLQKAQRHALKIEIPKQASDLEFYDSGDERMPYLVHNRTTGKYIRLGEREHTFLRRLDGSRSLEDLRREFSETLSEAHVDALLSQFANLQLLEKAEGYGRPRGRLKADGASSIQLTLLNPDSALDRISPLITFLGGKVGSFAGITIVLGGALSLLLNASSITSALQRPVSVPLLLSVLGAVFLATLLHELGHAAAVKYYGGRVNRMGIMLFYLLPALFCDASDSWKLSNRWHRVAISFAGIYFQFVVSGLAALLLLVIRNQAAQSWLVLFVTLNLLMCAWNSIPFVKLDGYWMLMNAVDIPNLRSKALGYLVAACHWLLFGGRNLPDVRYPFLWLLFGCASALCGPLLLLIALTRYREVLLGFGAIGAAAWLVLAGIVLLTPVAGLLARLRDFKLSRRFRSLLRATLILCATLTLVIVAAAQIELPVKLQGSYRLQPGHPEQAVLYVDPEQARLVQTSGKVELQSPSFLIPERLASGGVVDSVPEWSVVKPVPSVPVEVPRGASDREQATFQIKLDYDGNLNDGGTLKRLKAYDDGPATVELEREPLPQWLYETHLRPAIDEL